jgi:hypothetical protein
MRKHLPILLLFSITAAALLLALCTGPTKTASGGGTETVIGSIMDTSGAAAPDALVRLFPASYNPAADTTGIYSGTTDASGNFLITGVLTGDYTVYAVSADRRTKVLIPGIQVRGKDISLSPAMLYPVGSVRIEAPAGSSLTAGYVFVPGTDIMVKIDSATASAFLDSLPGQTIPSLWFYPAKGSAPVAVLRDSVQVAAGDTVLVANAGWAHVRQVFVNTTPSGAAVTRDVLGFPLLVRLAGATFDFSSALTGGTDVRFTKSNGTPIPFEIDRWDTAVRTAEIWVRLDTVKGNDGAQSFFMYWGNPLADNQSNGPAVFDTLSGFVGAWHMAQNGNTPRTNSSQSRYDAAPANFTGREHVPGVIGGADSLNGIDQYYTLGSGMADWSQGITYSVWSYPTAVVQCAAFMDFGNGAPGDNILFTRYNQTENLCVQIYNDTLDGGKTNAPSMFLNQWQHFAFIVTGRRVTYYKNGVFVKSDTSAQAIRTVVRSKNFFGKNNWAVPQDSYFAGMFDEIEISSVERTVDWIKLSYETQRPGNSVLTFK